MNAPRPFFLLIGRASVLWISVLGLIVVMLVLTGLAQPDEHLGLQFDTRFVAAFLIPGCAGWLAGAVIQEFQHTTFAAMLPGVGLRIASGFLLGGLVVTGAVIVIIALSDFPGPNLPVLLAIGLGAYCLGGIFLDPLSVWITSLNVALVLLVIARSSVIGPVAYDNPWLVSVVSIGLGAACVMRLFARTTFLRKPFSTTVVIPGRFSLEQSRRYQRQWMARHGPVRTAGSAGYLGNAAWRWARAAVHERYGAHVGKTISRAISRAWGLAFLILIYAWADKGDLGLGEALARMINDALFRSPYQAQFGERGGPYALVMIVIAAAGIVTALLSPVALNDAMAYPLSRRQHARVFFRCGLIDAAIFLLIVSPGLLVIGHFAGWLVGYGIRFDFMPFFFRVLLITLILMPLGYQGRLKLQAAARHKAENTMLVVIFAVIGFVAVVGFLTFLSPRVFGSPAVELAALAAVLLASRLIYSNWLQNYFRFADLA